jgi:hypothetical protein
MSANAGATNINLLFELDGNPQNTATAGDDWDQVLLGGGGSSIANSGVIVDPAGQTIFTTGGSKDDLDNNNWRHTTGSVPDKDEITNAYAAAYKGTNDELILYFGADRLATNGSSNVGFWFFQKPVAPNANGTFDGTPHTVGDLLVLSQFTNGGAVPNIQVYEWVGSGGDTNNTLNLVANGGDCSTASATAKACAIVNAANTNSPWPYTPKSGAAGVFKPGGFFEGGINVSDIFGAGGNLPCFSSFLAETRSSPSVDATLKDFTGGSFPLCSATIAIGPSAVNKVGDTHTFTVTINKKIAGATTPAPDGTKATVTLTESNGAAVTNKVDNCATTGTVNGTCTVTFTSNTAGVITAHASASVQVSDSLITVQTNGLAGNSGDATKRFVDARISILPDDVNGIGESHTFTVDVDQNDGLPAGAPGDATTGFGPAANGHVDFTLTNAGGAINVVDTAASTCDDTGQNLNASGQCSITFKSDSAGTVTGHATVTLTVGGVSITRASDSTHGSTGDAVKTFVDGSLAWHKVDNLGNPLGGATFQVCRTHNWNSNTDTMVDITDDCVSVADDVLVDNPDATTPDADNAPGEFLLSHLILGRYTVVETAAPAGYALDPDTVTVDLTLGNDNNPADRNKTITEAFVDVQLFKLIVITCNQVDNKVVDSTVTLSGVDKETIKAGQLPANISEADVCGLAGANYGNLTAGTYNPSVELPDKPPLFPPTP